jgi:D-serine deaminase-like pyridoxal phosphate-dependent protein
VPNHCCAAANLADEYLVVDGNGETAPWPVDARGRNR